MVGVGAQQETIRQKNCENIMNGEMIYWRKFRLTKELLDTILVLHNTGCLHTSSISFRPLHPIVIITLTSQSRINKNVLSLLKCCTVI